MTDKPLPDYKLIKNMILFAEIMKQGRFGVNPRYPEYWRLVKEAVLHD